MSLVIARYGCKCFKNNYLKAIVDKAEGCGRQVVYVLSTHVIIMDKGRVEYNL